MHNHSALKQGSLLGRLDRIKPMDKAFLGGIVLLLLIATLLFLHVPYLNGPWYWKWQWQTPGIQHYLVIMSGFVPFFLAQYVAYQHPGKRSWALILLALTHLLLQGLYTYTEAEQGVPQRITAIITSPVATSYFTAAQQLESVPHFLSHYADYLDQFRLHAKNKPFGAVLFYTGFLKLFSNPEQAAFWGGLTNMVLASTTVLLVYKLVRVLYTNSQDWAWEAASYYTIIPAAIGFCPGYDQVFPVLAILLVISWVRVLQTQQPIYSGLFALVLILTTAVTWNVLTIGLLLMLLSLYYLRRKQITLRQLAGQALVVAGIFAGFYTLFGLLSGYNLITVFQSCLEQQEQLEARLNRPWPWTSLFDTYDFFLGNGYLALFLMTGVLVRYPKTTLYPVFTLIIIVQLLIMAAGHLLPGETARVWLFLQPFAVIAGVPFFHQFRLWQKMSLLAGLALITTLITQHMTFIS